MQLKKAHEELSHQLGRAPTATEIANHLGIDREEVVHVMDRLRNGEDVANFEARMRCRDGTVRYVLVNSNVHWVDGRFAHTRSSTVDITDQKRGESLLREHNRLLELIVRGLSEQECMLAVCDAVGRLSTGTRAIILLTDPARHHFAEVIAPGFDESLELALLATSVKDRAAGAWLDAFRGRMSVTLPDVAADPSGPSPFRTLCLANGILGWHAAPVRGRDDLPVGVVLLCFDLPREPNAWKLRIAEFATNTAGVVLERERAREALSENERRLAEEAQALARLHASSVRLWAASSVAEGLEAMIDAVMELMGTDMGNFQLMDRERGKLVMAVHRGFGPGYLETFSEVAPGDASACGRALRSRDRVIIEDVEADAAYAPYLGVARATGYRSVVATPLIGRDGIPLGVVSTHTVMPHRPDEQALRRLDVFIRLAVDFIERVGAETRLREADRRKDEFLATLAHELRNPLAPMRNALALMKQTDDPAHAVHARETMDRQLDHMVRLIDDLLDVGRITRDKLELRRERVDLSRIIRDAVEASHPLFDEAGQVLEVVLPVDPVFLDADPARMAQVFGNLLTNASKYTDHGGRIELIAERIGEQAVVRVRDNGIGIPPHLVDSIFEMFSQVDQSFERTRGGLGIGLTLARRLVMLHQGSITVRSNGHGAGTTFEVRLPALSAPAFPAARPAQPGPAGPVEPRRILVVDDNRDAAVTLAMLLRIEGHVTEVAYDGIEARDKALAWKPDVMILDLGLPGMNGYEVCRAVREGSNGHQVFMVALTGWGQESDQQRSAEAGFHVHLVKPVAPGQLREILGASMPGRDRSGPAGATGSGAGGAGN